MSYPRNPDDSFLDVYMRYTAQQESPTMFHFWVGSTVLAAALGRKCYMNKRFYRLYPNFFTTLVAGSGRCRKSTAIALGVDLLDKIPNILKFQGTVTQEQFLREIHQATPENGSSPTVLVYASELSAFLKHKQNNKPLIDTLTDLFDCPSLREYKTKNRGIDIVRDAFICILAATTPRGVARSVPEEAREEGYASRVIWVFQAAPEPNRYNDLTDDCTDGYTREETPEESNLKNHAQELLISCSSLSGEFKLTPAGRDWYRTWYKLYMETETPDRHVEGMFSRKHDHILRTGLIIAASYRSKLIDEHILEASLVAINQVEDLTPLVFSQVGSDMTTYHFDRFCYIMRRFKILAHSEALRRMYPCDAKAFEQIVLTAEGQGLIRREVDRGYKYVWIAAEKELKKSQE